MKYKHILFDLDGTLTDSAEGITKCVAHALKHFDIIVEDLDSLKKFIGPSLRESFMKYYNFTEEQCQEATEVFRERFATIGKFENKLYDGIPELLKLLKEKGHKLYIATSKPTIFANQILEHFEIDCYFDDVIGSEFNGVRDEKVDVIAYAVKEFPIEVDSTIMVGDRSHDVLGANQYGISTIGVAYGFGGRDELEESGAIEVVDTVVELEKVLMT